MATEIQQELAVQEPKTLAPKNSMDLLTLALQKEAAIDVIERLAALQEKAMAREAEIDFNDALNRVQAKIKRIAPDLENPQKHSRYASYAAIDRVIRPIYFPEGFSLSFTHADTPKPEHIRVICRVALRAHVQLYQMDMPVDTKGAKGGDVMTPTHGTAAADSYAKRYLVKDVFNIAIGEADTDGNTVAGGMTMDADYLSERCADITKAQSLQDLWERYKTPYKEAMEAGDKAAQDLLMRTKDARKKEILSKGVM